MHPNQVPDQTLIFIFSYSVTVFGFIFYHIITGSPSFRLWQSQSVESVKPVMVQRLTGIFFFGFIPLYIFTFRFYTGLNSLGTAVPVTGTFIWTIVLACAIIPMNYFNSRNPDNLQQYPQVRLPVWTCSSLILSAVSWIAYLLAYEFMFRGFLLFSSIPVIGLWPAIILNTGIYSLEHIPKGNKETLGAIPFGILISYLAVETGSFWIGFFAHSILALSNEWFSLKAHPEMHLKRTWK